VSPTQLISDVIPAAQDHWRPGKKMLLSRLDSRFVFDSIGAGQYMERHRIVNGWLPLAVIVVAAVSFAVPGPQSGRTRICVVAVHDSGFLTMCPSGSLIKSWKYPGRTQGQEIIRNDSGPRPAIPQHIIQLDRPVLDRSRAGWVDSPSLGAAAGQVL
jgi:hypothetical protein